MKSLRQLTEIKAAIGRNLLSVHMLVSFQPLNRIYFYHHMHYAGHRNGYNTFWHRKCSGKWREIKTEIIRPIAVGNRRHIAEKFKET